jgi:hypothetical protein
MNRLRGAGGMGADLAAPRTDFMDALPGMNKT